MTSFTGRLARHEDWLICSVMACSKRGCVQALADFRKRIEQYEKVYEPLTDGKSNRHVHFIQLVDIITGRGHIDINRISGYIPGKIVFFLMQARPLRAAARTAPSRQLCHWTCCTGYLALVTCQWPHVATAATSAARAGLPQRPLREPPHLAHAARRERIQPARPRRRRRAADGQGQEVRDGARARSLHARADARREGRPAADLVLDEHAAADDPDCAAHPLPEASLEGA
jgi:6-phosphofructo-2-kinase